MPGLVSSVRSSRTRSPRYRILLCPKCYPYIDPYCEICQGHGEYEVPVHDTWIPV